MQPSTQSELDGSCQSVQPGSPEYKGGEDRKNIRVEAVAKRSPGEASNNREWDQDRRRCPVSGSMPIVAAWVATDAA
jgi:hypothetical protein